MVDVDQMRFCSLSSISSADYVSPASGKLSVTKAGRFGGGCGISAGHFLQRFLVIDASAEVTPGVPSGSMMNRYVCWLLYQQC